MSIALSGLSAILVAYVGATTRGRFAEHEPPKRKRSRVYWRWALGKCLHCLVLDSRRLFFWPVPRNQSLWQQDGARYFLLDVDCLDFKRSGVACFP